MRNDEMNDLEIRPDPLLAAALRSAEGEPPLDAVDWDALRTTVRERAELPLARRRRPARTPRWLAPLVPLAAAASVAMALWVGGLTSDRAAPAAARAASGGVTTEEVLRADVSEQEFRLLVSGRSNPDVLLALAVEGS